MKILLDELNALKLSLINVEIGKKRKSFGLVFKIISSIYTVKLAK
ncbi:hypothetical protein K737_300531 [Holospora undulata HU1]|uniref:Uncharacterized protein n=1 Tax=Holospora undulata HU1 TaxID=1321371 RepID=A0A061JHT9_9PROT|nr:hypothetical protein K737_300531 [Holospora undulata HU1]